MSRRELGALAILACLMVGVGGCGGQGGAPERPEPNVILRFYWPGDRGPTREIPAATERIEVYVGTTMPLTGPPTLVIDKSQVVGGVAQASLFLMPGVVWYIQVQAFDAVPQVIGASGITDVTPIRGATTQVNIVMTAFTPQLAVAPSTLDFRTMGKQLTFTVSNVGNLAMNWSASMPDVPWMANVSAPSGTPVPPGGSETVTVDVTRAGVSPGTYSADIAVTSDGGDAAVTCVITVIEHPWPMFRQNPWHTGFSPYIGAQTPTLKWAFTTGGEVWSSPAVAADGTVYVGSTDYNLYAVNPDGTQKWAAPTNYTITSSPAIAPDGTIYALSHQFDSFTAFNPDGTVKWTLPELYGGSSPTVGPDGTVYVAARDAYLHALNPDGTEKWAFSTYYPTDTSPAVGPDGTVYVSYGSQVSAVAPDGTQRPSPWPYGSEAYVTSSPALGPDGTIYVGYGGFLMAINPDGSEKWMEDTGGDTTSPAIAPDGTIVVGAGTAVIGYNPDGTIKWSYDLPDDTYSSPAIGADGTIYIGCDDGSLYALNPDGTQKWAFLTGGAVESSPAIGADGTVYVGSFDGKLYAIAGPPEASGDIPVVVQ